MLSNKSTCHLRPLHSYLYARGDHHMLIIKAGLGFRIAKLSLSESNYEDLLKRINKIQNQTSNQMTIGT